MQTPFHLISTFQTSFNLNLSAHISDTFVKLGYVSEEEKKK